MTRHQAFVLARIGSCYKLIAVVHQQYLDSFYVPGTARRFIRQVQQTTNKKIIQEELRRLAADETLLSRALPSRYLSSTLASAYLVAIAETITYADGVGLQWSFREREDIKRYDNDGGYSVFDLTNLDALRCCFFPGKKYNFDDEDLNPDEDSNHDTLDPFSTMDALDYVNTREESKLPEEYRSAGFQLELGKVPHWHHDVKFLLDFPLVSYQALCETWPETFKAPDSTLPVARGDLCSELDDEGGHAIPSLSSLVLVPAMLQAINTGNFTLLDDILLLPGRTAVALDTLKTSAQFREFSDGVVDLLVRLLEEAQKTDSENLDLSHYPLSTAQIHFILQRFDTTTSIDLSYNPRINKDTVQAILTAHPNLKHLTLLDTSITQDDWHDLLSHAPEIFYRVHSIIHPCFLDAFKPFWPNAFSIASTDYGNFGQGNTASIPFFTPSLVLQAVTVFVEQIADKRTIEAAIRAKSSLSTIALSKAILQPGQVWEDRTVPFFAPRLWSNCATTGWVFAFSSREPRYGFLKLHQIPTSQEDDQGSPDPSATTSEQDHGVSIKVFDFEDFLAELEKEGRPPAPVKAVKRLSRRFKYLSFEGYGDSRVRVELFTQAEAEKFIHKMNGTLDSASIGLDILEDPAEDEKRRQERDFEDLNMSGDNTVIDPIKWAAGIRQDMSETDEEPDSDDGEGLAPGRG